MLDVEAALARALVRAGVGVAPAAEEVASAADASVFDPEQIEAWVHQAGTPIPGLLAALRDRMSEGAGAQLHRGATSQDIVDTAMMVTARRVLGLVVADLGAAADTCARLVERHRDTLMVGRTLLQQAGPITFGLKAAGWLGAIDAARGELAALRATGLFVQLGGAVGTLAALSDERLAVVTDVAEQLGLAAPEAPWHTHRRPVARLACALGVALGSMGKIATDVVLLAQTEVAEVRAGDSGRGASSAMPHKRNPVDAIAVLASVQQGPGLVATILGAMVQEHERAAGAWQAEWQTLPELLRLTRSAAAALRELLAGLEIDPERMRANLESTGGLVMSESVSVALSRSLGRARADALVRDAAGRAVREQRPFREVLLDLDEVAHELGAAGVDAALDPAGFLGASDVFIDRALAAHRATFAPSEEG